MDSRGLLRRDSLRALQLSVSLAAVLTLSGCPRHEREPSRRAIQEGKSDVSTWTRADTTDGITWKVPPKWVNMPERPMRARTYAIPSPTGDEQPSECVVYYFNQGLSASKQANIERWCNQFEQPDGRNSLDVAKIEEMTVNDLAVTIVDLMGNYKMAAGPMMQVEDIRPGYRMIGAILEGPAGTVFFKMVGPQETISASKEDFMGLVSSAQKVAM